MGIRTATETAWIVQRARELGFALCGVARLEKFPEHKAFAGWLERGYAGEMAYLADARRQEPSEVLAGARSAIVCALNYNTAHPYSNEVITNGVGEARGWISRYAWGRDYHEVMRERLNALVAALKEKFPGEENSRAYADTGPIAERIFAKHAGLGWLGKNTLLLNQELGSWFFLGVILTTLELEPSLAAGEMPPADLCGNCRQCLDACPTGALVEPYVLDARKCISYLTIELRGAIPGEFRERMGRHVYGCDICQEVCPYNRAAPVTEVREFEPRSWEDGRGSVGSIVGMAGGNDGGGVSGKISWERDEADEVAGIGQECVCGLGECEVGERIGGARARFEVVGEVVGVCGNGDSGICPMGTLAHQVSGWRIAARGPRGSPKDKGAVERGWRRGYNSRAGSRTHRS